MERLLYSDRPQIEQDFIKNVCNHILIQPLERKEESRDFCGIFVEGRNRQIDTLEDFAALYSFNAFSQKKYPLFCFINNDSNFLNNDLHGYHMKNRFFDNVEIIKIPPLTSLEEYSNFWRFELYNSLPQDLEHGISIQADGFLLRPNYEDFILNNKWDFIGAHFKHMPSIDVKFDGEWESTPKLVYGFNGGFSYRNLPNCRKLSNISQHFKFRERFAPNNKEPQEDLLLSVLLNENGSKIPTLKEADLWSQDPLTIESWANKTYGYGFHYFRTKSEFKPCNHE